MKKMVFICGSIEPGRDGLGDYSIRLGKALERHGIHVCLLAISDRFVSQPTMPSDNILRLPASMSSSARYRLAGEAINRWSPDWCSLQFVSWTYGWKGIVLHELFLLKKILSDRPLHFMLHEPWVTTELEINSTLKATVRRNVLGFLQKKSIKLVFQVLRPKLVQTTNLAYVRLLKGIGVSARQLPLFGNIDIAEPESWQISREMISKKTGIDVGDDPSRVILAGMFGSLRLCPVEPALRALTSANNSRRVVLLSLGNPGREADSRIAEWRQAVPGIEVGVVGPLDDASLSRCMRQFNIGISLHPSSVIGRSGAVAAFLEHGIPVISPWGKLPGVADEFMARWSGMIYSAEEDIGRALCSSRMRVPTFGLPEATARQLMSEMKV